MPGLTRVRRCSEGEVGTNTREDGGLDGPGRTHRVSIGDSGESTCGSLVTGTTEIVPPGNCVTTVGRVHGTWRVDENIVLDQKLGTVASINPKVDSVEVVVVNAGILRERQRRDRRTETSLLASSEAEGWGARVEMGKVVVVEGDAEGLILPPIVVRVTNEGCLPVLAGR